MPLKLFFHRNSVNLRGKLLNINHTSLIFRCHVNTFHWTQWRSGLFVSGVERDSELLYSF